MNMYMNDHKAAWAFTGLGITLFLVIVGVLITRGKNFGWASVFGMLIDERKRYSLSRLQLLLWTILLVSAFGVVAFVKKTIDIYLAPEVWALMGISVGSAAGSVIVKGTKAGMKPDTKAKSLRTALGVSEFNIIPGVSTGKNSRNRKSNDKIDEEIQKKMSGVLYVADKPSLGDIFKGEEGIDHDYVDIGKVQNFFFTLAVIFGYVLALSTADLNAKPVGMPEAENYAAYFPTLSTSMVTLLGISHAGYLTMKAAPHTKTE